VYRFAQTSDRNTHKKFGTVTISLQYHRTDFRRQERGRRVVCTGGRRKCQVSEPCGSKYPSLAPPPPAACPSPAPDKYYGQVSEGLNDLTLVLNEPHPPTPLDSAEPRWTEHDTPCADPVCKGHAYRQGQVGNLEVCRKIWRGSPGGQLLANAPGTSIAPRLLHCPLLDGGDNARNAGRRARTTTSGLYLCLVKFVVVKHVEGDTAGFGGARCS